MWETTDVVKQASIMDEAKSSIDGSMADSIDKKLE